MKFIIPLIVLLSVVIFPKNVQQMMKDANKLYREGKFEAAIETYKQIEKGGYEGTSLYYNLGNSFYRVGKIGYAILNYEKALKLSPTDEDAKHNLAFANLSTVDKIQPLPEFFLFVWWDSLLASFTVNGWTYIVYFFFILLLILVSLYFFVRTIFQQKLVLFSGLGILVVLALTISLLIVKINREQTLISGVVVEQSVTAKTSPDSKSGLLY